MIRDVEYQLFKSHNNAKERGTRHVNAFMEISDKYPASIKKSLDKYYEPGMTVEELNRKILKEDSVKQAMRGDLI